jgi:hypothetical protein
MIRIAKKNAEEALESDTGLSVTLHIAESKEPVVEPILFEECYVNDSDKDLVARVKSSTAVMPR